MRHIGFWVTTAAVASLGTGLLAQEDATCDRLDRAMAATENDTVPVGAIKDILGGFGPSPATCSFSVDISGSKSTNCHWAFSFRSAGAQNSFSEMLAVLSGCADPASGIQEDLHVNHPDFYDLRVMQVMGGEVGLSLKDKSGLQQTYVFLRLTPKG